MNELVLDLLFGLAAYFLGALTISIFAAGRIARLEAENERLKRRLES